MPESRPVLAMVASLLLAAALTGCGPFGDDDSGGGTPSDEEFVQRGDEICRSSQERVAELRSRPPTTPQQSARFTEELIGIFEGEVAELSALEPPEEMRGALDRYLRARREAIGILERGLAAAEREDAQGYAEAQADVAARQLERAELAGQVGFSDCSRPVAGSAAAE